MPLLLLWASLCLWANSTLLLSVIDPPLQDINLPHQSHFLLRMAFHVSLPISGLVGTMTL